MNIIGKTGRRGFTLVEVMVVVSVLGVVSAIVTPNFIKARNSARVKSCISNLKQLDCAKAQWAFEYQKSDTSVPTLNDLAPYLQYNQTPPCPGGGTYRPRRVSRIPTCSLWSLGHTLNNLNMDDDPDAD
jgi:prepilin-type N-terminal cleavage/methylation domain-containing protein